MLNYKIYIGYEKGRPCGQVASLASTKPDARDLQFSTQIRPWRATAFSGIENCTGLSSCLLADIARNELGSCKHGLSVNEVRLQLGKNSRKIFAKLRPTLFSAHFPTVQW